MNNIKIISFNCEGLSAVKVEIISRLQPDILCLQETHKDTTPPAIPGMSMIVHQPSPVHGSAIYAKNPTIIDRSFNDTANNVEVLRVETTQMTVISVYKPPPEPFSWPQQTPLDTTQATRPVVIIGDFNSHNTIWGYDQNNADGEAVEEWAATNELTLLHDQKDRSSFQSARWRRGYNPDLVFVSAQHFSCFEKSIGDPIPKSQHRPMNIDIRPVVRALESSSTPRFNFRKANWQNFTSELERKIESIDPTPINYDTFQSLVWKIAKQHIPRGFRKSYIPCLTDDNKELYTQYIAAYNVDPFSEDTIALGEDPTASITKEKSERWRDLISSTDMTNNSKKAWTTIKKLNSEKKPQRVAAVTPDQVANQLIQNGKPAHKERGQTKKLKSEMDHALQGTEEEIEPFTMDELEEALTHSKPGKAAGIDGITTEMIQHFGPNTMKWILTMVNKCATTCSIPKKWRKARVVALLKPGKDPSSRKSYRPISLLCILYKVYERLIMARISPTVEKELSKDQAGFRPGRSTCGQLLNLTQHIEDGYETKNITGTVFVDLTAAYDTVNHRILLLKVAKMMKNKAIVNILMSLLNNRRFFVEMDGKKSRWRTQKNGLPQGSVLAPTLFNIYTNDQPEFVNIRRFIYADDLCLATQSTTFETIEQRLTDALSQLTVYYQRNSLNANPGKTQVCAFHLKNQQANRKLKIQWNNQELEYNDFPVYLGVTLDRTLTYSEHVRKVKGKVSTRNNLLTKLANSSWGTDPRTLRTTALALSYSTAEYCCAVWGKSCHAKKINPELNNACRVITGNLRPTPLPSLYRLAGIAPPEIRRDTMTRTEKFKQEVDERHPLYEHIPATPRLKSRKSFMKNESLNLRSAYDHKIESWREWDQSTNDALPEPNEQLPRGTHLQRKDWVTLNRGRAKVGKTGENMKRWGIQPTSECSCGHPSQTMEHILESCELGPRITNNDLLECSDAALEWIQSWRDKI